MGLYRVVRTAPAVFDRPCSSDTEEVVWEGDDPSSYTEGLGTFDEGCHHPSRRMQRVACAVCKVPFDQMDGWEVPPGACQEKGENCVLFWKFV